MKTAFFENSKFFESFKGYSAESARGDLVAGVNVMVVAFPLSMAFAIASGAKPEQGLFSAIIGGIIVALLSGSRVQIAGPTRAVVAINYSILQSVGLNSLFLCTIMAGGMVCFVGFRKFGTLIRLISL